jgi:glycosyltransferase involved in cell wall biosynthesis
MYQLSPAILPLLRDTPAIYQEATYKSICLTGTRVLPDGRACGHIAGRVCLTEGCVTPQSWAVLMLQRALWLRGRDVFSRYVALSHAMKTELERGGLSPVHVMHNGVPERPMRPPLSAPPRVVFAGRLAPEKGVDRLLRVFARVRELVPDAVLEILGDGPLRASLETLAHTLGVSAAVHFHGHLMRDAMEAACDGAWVQAVPSQWAEPFGNVSTEAMMRGTAVLASDVGGQRDIVAHESTGMLLPPQDDDAWHHALVRLLSDRALAEAYGEAGRQRALALFSESASLDRWEAMYHAVISEHTQRLSPATTPPA